MERNISKILVFIPAKKDIRYFTGTTRIESSKSYGISEERIENITKSDGNFAPTFDDHCLLPNVNYNGHCLIKINISIPRKVINPYIPYTPSPQLKKLNTDFTLGNCLFGSVRLTKNADPDKNKYSGYGIRFDSPSEFLFTNGNYGKNLSFLELIFWSSSVHLDNKRKELMIREKMS